MDELILSAIEQSGYIGIFALMVLENVIPPVPSEVIMGTSGLLVEQGRFSFWPLLFIATSGTLTGQYFWYWIGDRFGYERLGPFIDRWGRWLTVDWQDIERAAGFFSRWGHWVVFIFRFSPIMRTLISLPAGVTHMPKGKFILYTVAGSLIWNGALIKGGQIFGRYFEQSQSVLTYVLIGSLGLTLMVYLWRLFTWKPRSGGS